ncbi:DNA-binding FadR family transcriptional regulator [Motilibacter rhizosphaerae]|uniref:DNA-binding FadR family transcriptional regulator n=1 Tax=Motilibacter rhizosphaerae TaxID=598652 RepID=A0A4Q7NSP8_9ACTN|nr:FCD domain-containing protein [Motilibacter rhizosphaerae]RZS90055.1 DNA-binding FadR family transcriptional regulator [Motilibacter rhizosphaerae]
MPLQRAPLAEQAAAAVADGIRAGRWAVGDRLPGEAQLAEELGVGRSTVREAVRVLAGAGMVESRQGAGTYVRAAARSGWGEALRRAEVVEVVEAREALEVEGARLAAERRTEEDLAALDAALAERAAAVGGPAEAYVDADLAFHRAVVAAAGNPLLLELVDLLRERVRTAMLDYLRLQGEADPPAEHDLHARIVERVRQGDAEGAARAARGHLVALARRAGGVPAA